MARALCAHHRLPGAAALATVAFLAHAAAAQQATPAQQNAIRQACPKDYQAHCANVPAAGREAFVCLERNLPTLSAPCQRAVGAVAGGGAPAAVRPVMPAAPPGQVR